MHEPAAPRAAVRAPAAGPVPAGSAAGRLGSEQPAHRDARHRELVGAAEVREHDGAEDVAVRQQARRRPDTALPAQALHAGAGADGALRRAG